MWTKPEDQQLVGEILADARRYAGLHQSQLADRIGRSQSWISNYEAGQRRIDVIELLKIAETLGVSAEDLFLRIARRWRARERAITKSGK